MLLELDELKELWRMKMEEDARIQVAEQYFLYPSFAAAAEVVRRGFLGEASMMTLSAVHDYHGASVIRRMLGTGLQNMTIYGKEYPFTLMETDSRDGAITDGRMSERTRRPILRIEPFFFCERDYVLGIHGGDIGIVNLVHFVGRDRSFTF